MCNRSGLTPDSTGCGADLVVVAVAADAMLEKGAIDGQRVWKRVLAAVKEIQRQEPRKGEAVNCGCLDFTPWEMSAFGGRTGHSDMP